jgi:hypothetical protein
LGGAVVLPSNILLSDSSAPSAQTEIVGKVPLRIIVVDSLALANRVLERLKKGENFASLATEWSIDPTAKEGGYLGNFEPSALRPELREALRGIGRGQLSPVFKIPEGYAILLVERQDQPDGLQQNPSATLALIGPGAVHYGPDVDGFGESFAFFYRESDKPKGWDRLVNPVMAAEIRHRSIESGIRQLQEMMADSSQSPSPGTVVQTRYLLAQLYAFQGEMGMAIEQWQVCYRIARDVSAQAIPLMEEVLGIAHLHKAEMENGVYLEPGDRCLFPMTPGMRYPKTEDSKRAVEYFTKYLNRAPNDLEGKWLLNLACLTLGEYPSGVPNQHVIPLTAFESTQDIGRFIDIAPKVGLDVVSDAGGIIVDDFEDRGLFDIVLSEMGDQNPHEPLRYFRNNGDGTFSNQTERSGLNAKVGGLNLIQADYNNDGHLDFLVLRGAWMFPQPLGLFRGRGDGTFEDVSIQAGLTELIRTQTAVWADINNDGLLDLFVGNEQGPSHLFLNNGDGTFQDISASAGVDKIAFTKGVVAGDYDNDGFVDFYVTNIGNANFLYHNQGNNTFTEVAKQAGVRDPLGKSFATWFFDYDNDGWLDLFVTSYYAGSVDENMRSYLGLPLNAITLKLYKNHRDGTFLDVTSEVGLDKVFMPMGANFGDVDNDGFLDIYLGTGNPSYGSIVPNVLLRNDEGKRFVDITASSGTGELHKGHGVAFADMSNSGQQDLLTVIGGATPGDRHAFRFFRNPGNNNNWIAVKLVGGKSNRSAIGARIKVTVENKGRGQRSIYCTVGSGGSFGANPLQQHIGLGPVARITELEVWWPASKTRQVFSKVHTNQFIEIREFADQYVTRDRPKLPMGTRA